MEEGVRMGMEVDKEEREREKTMSLFVRIFQSEECIIRSGENALHVKKT